MSRAGQVIERLHLHSELEFTEVDIRAGLSERSIRRIVKEKPILL